MDPVYVLREASTNNWLLLHQKALGRSRSVVPVFITRRTARAWAGHLHNHYLKHGRYPCTELPFLPTLDKVLDDTGDVVVHRVSRAELGRTFCGTSVQYAMEVDAGKPGRVSWLYPSDRGTARLFVERLRELM